MTRYFLLALAALGAVGLSGEVLAQGAVPPAPAPARTPAPETVVATVNGSPITYADLVEAQERLPEQYRQIPLDIIYSTLLEQLIRGKLMVVDGRKQGLLADPEVKKKLTALEDQAIQQVYTQRLVDKQVTETAMRQRYTETVQQQSLPLTEAHPPRADTATRWGSITGLAMNEALARVWMLRSMS